VEEGRGITSTKVERETPIARASKENKEQKHTYFLLGANLDSRNLAAVQDLFDHFAAQSERSVFPRIANKQPQRRPSQTKSAQFNNSKAHRWLQYITSFPLTMRMRSPGSMPAISAGPPGSTLCTTWPGLHCWLPLGSALMIWNPKPLGPRRRSSVRRCSTMRGGALRRASSR
jgi:hypothetical protein